MSRGAAARRAASAIQWPGALGRAARGRGWACGRRPASGRIRALDATRARPGAGRTCCGTCVAVALCAVRCGADGWVAVATCGRAKAAWLRTFLALPGGIPSHDPCGRVFARRDPAAFRRCFLAWVGRWCRTRSGRWWPATARRCAARTTAPTARRRCLWCAPGPAAAGWCWGRWRSAAKSNASTAIPALLRLLALDGATVTSDALGGQTASAAQRVAQGADDALALQDTPPDAARRGRGGVRRRPRGRVRRLTPRPTTTTGRRSSRTTGARDAALRDIRDARDQRQRNRAMPGRGGAPSAWSSASAGSARR